MKKKGNTTLDGKTNKLYNSLPDKITKKAAKEFVKLGEAQYLFFGGRVLKGFLIYEGRDYVFNKKLKAYELKVNDDEKK